MATINLLDIPWQRYGLIAELARAQKKRGLTLGKTALQKEVYFLQTLYGVDCGYEFTLYTYGPFSSLLLADLDSVSVLGGVEIEYDSGVRGYRILPGPENAKVIKSAEEFLSGIKDPIDSVIEEFGGLYAKDLELQATIVFAEREARDSGKPLTTPALADVVKGVKPHFTEFQIGEAIEKLVDKAHIAVASSAAI
jgi:uncharacterized protein